MLILISPLLKGLLAEQICIFLTSQLIIIKNLAKPPNPLPPAILTYPFPSPRAQPVLPTPASTASDLQAQPTSRAQPVLPSTAGTASDLQAKPIYIPPPPAEGAHPHYVTHPALRAHNLGVADHASNL